MNMVKSSEHKGWNFPIEQVTCSQTEIFDGVTYAEIAEAN